jgi:hypothetical protein
VVKRKKYTDARNQIQGETKDLVCLHKTPTVGMKLSGSNVQSMKHGNLKRGKGEPKIESLHNVPVPEKIMRRIMVNYSNELSNIYGIYNDVAFPSGARQLDSPPLRV